MIGWRHAACAVAFAGVAACTGQTPTLRLAVLLADETVVWDGPVLAGERFDLVYRHSSEHCRWTHRYEVDARGGIRQRGSAFPCYGAGMPAASTDGSPVTLSDDGFEVAAPLDLGRVPMINSRGAAITLRHRARNIAIGDLMPDLAAFAIEVR